MNPTHPSSSVDPETDVSKVRDISEPTTDPTSSMTRVTAPAKRRAKEKDLPSRKRIANCGLESLADLFRQVSELPITDDEEDFRVGLSNLRQRYKEYKQDMR